MERGEKVVQLGAMKGGVIEVGSYPPPSVLSIAVVLGLDLHQNH